MFYIFTPLSDPEAIVRWQKSLAGNLNLKGRIIISKQGINGTLGGEIEDLKKYIKENKTYQNFKPMEYKWSDVDDQPFPRLSIKVRDELVTFGAKDEVKVTKKGIKNGGQRLSPRALHDLVKSRNDEVVFFDGRNKYEAAVGRFKKAVVANTRTAKDFIPELESGKYDNLKDKPVVTYCTGGIRCEILSALMKNRGFKEVYQLDGGIVKYGQKFGDKGLWQGSLYVFDGRMGQKFSDSANDVGRCSICNQKTSNYANCALKSCNDLVLICPSCLENPDNHYHSKKCLLADQIVA